MHPYRDRCGVPRQALGRCQVDDGWTNAAQACLRQTLDRDLANEVSSNDRNDLGVDSKSLKFSVLKLSVRGR